MVIYDLFKKEFRNSIYNIVLGDEKYLGNISTSSLYRNFLNDIPDGSSILEIGCGNGICWRRNSSLIKSKSLTIKGIDIDKDYVEFCKEVVQDCELYNCTVEKSDFLKLHEESNSSAQYYDYVIFVESYPVISADINREMLDACKMHMHRNSKVVYIHNILYKENKFLDFIKPKLKHFVSADFGRTTTMKEFTKFVEDSGEYEVHSKRELIALKRINYPKAWQKSGFIESIISDLAGVQKTKANSGQSIFYLKLKDFE
jgi:hypothetical protein